MHYYMKTKMQSEGQQIPCSRMTVRSLGPLVVEATTPIFGSQVPRFESHWGEN